MPTRPAAALLAERNISTADELIDVALMLGAELPPLPKLPEPTGTVTPEQLPTIIASLLGFCRALEQRQHLLARLLLKRP